MSPLLPNYILWGPAIFSTAQSEQDKTTSRPKNSQEEWQSHTQKLYQVTKEKHSYVQHSVFPLTQSYPLPGWE